MAPFIAGPDTLDISVAKGPVRTACTLTPGPAKRARSDGAREYAAAFEIE
jgi:hypothetical protein